MSYVFPPPNRGLDNSLKGELDARRKSLHARTQALPDDRLLRLDLEPELLDELIEDFTFETLELGEPRTEETAEQIRLAEQNPRYAGPTGQGHPRTIDVFVVRVPLLKGSPVWLSHRPSGSFAPLDERVVYDSGRRAVVIRVLDDPRDDPHSGAAQSYLTAQLALLRDYVAATNAELAAWNDAVPEHCKSALERERRARESLDSRKRALGLPIFSTESTPVPYALPRKRRPRPRLAAAEVRRLAGRMYLPPDDFSDVLNEMQRSAQFIAEHPAVYDLDENGMRDIVLLLLNAAFPGGATGETFSKKGKSDIRVATTSAAASGFGDCVFKAECKVWDGPASSRDAIDQLCDRYLTAAELRAAIVLFARPPYERRSVTEQALAQLESSFRAERLDDIAAWPVVRLTHSALVHPVDVAVIVM